MRSLGSFIGFLSLVLLACAGPPPDGEAARGDRGTGPSEQAEQAEQVEPVASSQAEHDRRVDYVEFLATDIEATKSFYSSVFGWEFVDYGLEYTSFLDGRLAGGFALAPEVEAGGPLIVIYAVDLESTEAAVVANGGRIVRPTFEFPGGRRFHFADPSGNELAVWSE